MQGNGGGAEAGAVPGVDELRREVRGVVSRSAGVPADGWAVEGPVSEEGEIVHVFSHIRQTMVVRRWRLRQGSPEGGGGAGRAGEEDAAPRPTQWLTQQGLQDAALTTGVKKVRDLVFSGKKKAPARKGKAAAAKARVTSAVGEGESKEPGDGKKQGSLLQFFKKAD